MKRITNNPPLTLEEAQLGHYGSADFRWPLYYNGQCAWRVEDYLGLCHQCLRKPGHGPAGLYCLQHSRMIKNDDAV